MKKFIIAANWKMNKTVPESLAFLSDLDIRLKQWELNPRLERIEIVIFPPFTSLSPMRNRSSLVRLGSQNIYVEESGAFTGEISAAMIRDLAKYSLIGHSERREIFRETDTGINRKIKISLQYGLTPLLCVGETLDERESGHTFRKIGSQLEAGLNALSPPDIEKIVIAYEPVWAIGTGKTASPDQAQEVHAFIRSEIDRLTGKSADRMILYGGSVKPDNSRELLSKKDICGALIGGASLNVESFFAIIQESLELV